MKSRIPIIITATLLISSCKKQEETKPPTFVVEVPAPEKKIRPAAVPVPQVPAGTENQAKASPPTAEEIQSFLSDLDKLAKEVAQLPKDAAPSPEVDVMQRTYSALIQRRNALMAAMNDEQKAALMQDVNPLAKAISQPLVRLRLAKAREQMKNLSPPPQPGTPQPDSTLDNLIPQLKTPPAPAPQPAAPPQ